MTKEERELRREQREHMKRMEAAAKEAGRGPIARPNMTMARSRAMGALGANTPLLP